MESIIALSVFAVVSSITPGPNNLMLLASGMNYGFVKTIPHMLGVSIGFFVMCIFVGMGLSVVFTNYPLVLEVMYWAGTVYLLYLAWRIATAGAPGETQRESQDMVRSKPFTFLEASAFQWINPKAWAMAISAFSTYAPAARSWLMVAAVAALFALINLPCVSIWALCGTGIRRWLHNPRHAHAFNVVMALLLVATLIPTVFF